MMSVTSLSKFLALLEKPAEVGSGLSACSSGLQLHLGGNYFISNTELQCISKLLDANEKRHAALSCVAFLQGVRSPSLMVKKIPTGVIENIFSFVAPPLSKKQMCIFSNQVQQAACQALPIPDAKLSSEKAEIKAVLVSDVPAKKETDEISTRTTNKCCSIQ